MNELGKWMVISGVALALAGAVIWSGAGKGWLGRLPGDIHYTSEKGSFSFHFPIVTCLVLSVVLSLLLRLFRK